MTGRAGDKLWAEETHFELDSMPGSTEETRDSLSLGKMMRTGNCLGYSPEVFPSRFELGDW